MITYFTPRNKIEEPEIENIDFWPEEDEELYNWDDEGQPSEYDEWQDYMGGDDWDHGQFDLGDDGW